MTKKQVITRIIIILVISLVVAIAFFFGMKMYQSHKNIQLVDSYIEDKHLKGLIKKEETKYSAKKGVYYKEIVFKDEPKLTYVVQPISTRKSIFLEGFDTETKKNIKGAKHNTFDQNYKP